MATTNTSIKTKLSALAVDQALLWLPIIAGLIVLYVPSLIDLLRGIWSTDEQAHGPLF